MTLQYIRLAIIYNPLHNNVTSVCILIGCSPWSIKGHTYKWRQIHVSGLVLLFSCPQKPPIIFNKPFEFLLYKTNRLHFFVCVYCSRSQKTSQRVKNNSHATRLRLVSYFFVLYTLWRHLWFNYSTHARKNAIYLLIILLKNIVNYWYMQVLQKECFYVHIFDVITCLNIRGKLLMNIG